MNIELTTDEKILLQVLLKINLQESKEDLKKVKSSDGKNYLKRVITDAKNVLKKLEK